MVNKTSDIYKNGDCGFYINEIEGMYLDVIGRNFLKKLYHERNIILAKSNVL
jgi:hypothetical protein